jgi:hypothetical protein
MLKRYIDGAELVLQCYALGSLGQLHTRLELITMRLRSDVPGHASCTDSGPSGLGRSSKPFKCSDNGSGKVAEERVRAGDTS